MRKPSYEQIIDWKNRNGGRPRLGMELVDQIQELGENAEAVTDVASVYSDFVPIRLVTIIEVFLRGVIAELINSDETYFQRGEKLAKGAKIDLTFAFYVNRSELTVGDFVAHAVSLNSISNVMSVMDTLLGSFTSKLKSSHPRWTEETEEWPLPPIIEDYDTVVKSLARLYEIRHILTHELPVERVFNSTEIPRLVEAAKLFVGATDWVIVETVHGSVPHTQLAMNISAGDDLEREEKALASVLNDLSTLTGVDSDKLAALQLAWGRFADLQASLAASQVEGGSMYPMIWAGEKAALTRERISQLNRLKTEWMDV